MTKCIRPTAVLWSAFAAVALFAAGTARAQEAAEPPTAEQWKAERAQLEELIGAKVRTEVAKVVNPRRVAEGLVFPWPVKEPKATLPEMKVAIEKQVAAETEAKLPLAKEAAFKEEGQAKYKLLKAGDDIEFSLRGGRGANSHVQGKIMRVTADRLQVGTRWIATRDVDDDVLALLLPEANDRAVNDYVQRETRRYGLQRERFAEDARERITPVLMTDNGYVRVKVAKPGKFDPTAWQPMKTLFEAELEKQKAAAALGAGKTIEAEIYKANRYVFFENEWMPESVMQAVLAKRAEETTPAQTPETPGTPPPGTPPNVPPNVPPNMPPTGMVPLGMPPKLAPVPPGGPATPPAPNPPPTMAPPGFVPPQPPAVPKPVVTVPPPARVDVPELFQ